MMNHREKDWGGGQGVKISIVNKEEEGENGNFGKRGIPTKALYNRKRGGQKKRLDQKPTLIIRIGSKSKIRGAQTGVREKSQKKR